MGEIDIHSHRIITELNAGYIKGGLTKLRKEYPSAYNDLETELTKNFTIEGLNRYRDRLIKGLKQVGHWKI